MKPPLYAHTSIPVVDRVAWGVCVQPTGENGATRVPILIELQRDASSNRRGLAIQVDGRTQSVSASKTDRAL